jgi:hypothetical protein
LRIVPFDLHIRMVMPISAAASGSIPRAATLPFTHRRDRRRGQEVGPDVSGIRKSGRYSLDRLRPVRRANGDETCVKQRFTRRLVGGGFASRAGARRKVFAGFGPLRSTGRHADVLRRHRLRRSSWSTVAAAQSAADRARQRRHDGRPFAQAMFTQRIAVADLSVAREH